MPVWPKVTAQNPSLTGQAIPCSSGRNSKAEVLGERLLELAVAASSDLPAVKLLLRSDLIDDLTPVDSLSAVTNPAGLVVTDSTGAFARKLTPTGWGLSNLLASVPAGRVPFADGSGLPTSNAGLTYNSGTGTLTAQNLIPVSGNLRLGTGTSVGVQIGTGSIGTGSDAPVLVAGNNPFGFGLTVMRGDNLAPTDLYARYLFSRDGLFVWNGSQYTFRNDLGRTRIGSAGVPADDGVSSLQVSGAAAITGNLTLGNGAENSPSLNLGDPTTGFWRASSQSIGMTHQGTASIVFFSDQQRLRSTNRLGWASGSAVLTTIDTELTRSSAGFVGLGSVSNKVAIGHDGTRATVESPAGAMWLKVPGTFSTLQLSSGAGSFPMLTNTVHGTSDGGYVRFENGLELGRITDTMRVDFQAVTLRGNLTVRQPGGTAETDQIELSHNGTAGRIESKDGGINFVLPYGVTWDFSGGGDNDLRLSNLTTTRGISDPSFRVGYTANGLSVARASGRGLRFSPTFTYNTPDVAVESPSVGLVAITDGSTGYGSLIANQLQFTASGGAGGLGGLYLNDAASNAVRIRSSLGNPQLNIAGSAGTIVVGNGRLGLGSTHTITFHSNTDGSGSGDTRLRRSSANVLDLDTGTDNSFADLRMRNLIASGGLYAPNLFITNGLTASSGETVISTAGSQTARFVRVGSGAWADSAAGSFLQLGLASTNQNALITGGNGNTFGRLGITGGVTQIASGTGFASLPVPTAGRIVEFVTSGSVVASVSTAGELNAPGLYFNNASGSADLHLNAAVPTAAGNNQLGFRYFSNNQMAFGFYSGARINFLGSGSQAQLLGAWSFPSGGFYPVPALGASGGGGNDVRLNVTKTGDGASQTVQMTTQRFAVDNDQPALQISSNGFSLWTRGTAWNAGALSKVFEVASDGKMGWNGVTPVARQTLPAAATDPATTMALVNAIRDALIAFGPCQ